MATAAIFKLGGSTISSAVSWSTLRTPFGATKTIRGFFVDLVYPIEVRHGGVRFCTCGLAVWQASSPRMAPIEMQQRFPIYGINGLVGQS